MREVFYRAKEKDTGKWVYGIYSPYLWKCSNDTENIERLNVSHMIIVSDNKEVDGLWTEIDDKTLGEYIGYKDSYNQKIFEGDIVDFTFTNGAVKDRCLIRYKNNWNEFVLKFQNIYKDFYGIKVIGNIFENPELIEGVEN